MPLPLIARLIAARRWLLQHWGAIALLACAWVLHRAHVENRVDAALAAQAAQHRATLATLHAQASQRALDAASVARQREQAAQTALAQINQDAQDQIETAHADAAAARAAAERLRQQLARRAGACTPATHTRSAHAPPASRSASQPGAGADDLHTELLAGHISELVEVGQYADRLAASAHACERAYQAARQALSAPLSAPLGAASSPAPDR